MPPSDIDIDPIVAQFAEQASFLWHHYDLALRAPAQALRDLSVLGERINACLDGLRLAGEDGWRAFERQLTDDDPGALFAGTVLALETKHEQRLAAVFSRAETSALLQRGLLSAFGWTSPQFLQGTTKLLFSAASPFSRRLGIACCAMHRVAPGHALTDALNHRDSNLRARALRAVGELGLRPFANVCAAAFSDDDSACQFWGAWSAVLLGDRSRAVNSLVTIGLSEGLFRQRAFRMACQAMTRASAHEVLRTLSKNSSSLRCLFEGSGIVGDPTYIPWLLKQMRNDQLARIAGEAFTLITGADLSLLGFERKPPEDFESGPNDNPDDPNVDMDPDDGLPWPDVEKIEHWWATNGARFQPGTRYFMGAPVTRAHCIDVLKNGYQRQRILAAHYLCLLDPGTPLFNTSAPAWRQQRLLAQMA